MTEPVMIVADRRCWPDDAFEAEPVLARVKDGRLTLVMDDGETITLDAAEVTALLSAAA